MGSERYPLHNVGIYRNLPQFDPHIKGLKAIVTGANGISGFHTMRVLLESPERWTKVYALSRKPPPPAMLALLTEGQRSRIQHVAVDFLSEPSDIAQAMQNAGVEADYVFFYSYLQPKPPPDMPKSHAWSNADELVKINKALFKNFLQAVEQQQLKPKRVLLQTGAKNYGVHLGRTRTPSNESDQEPRHLEPNFYYPQYDLLYDYCKRNNVAWNIVCPAWIIGAVTTAQINGLHPFAVYAAVQAHRGEKLKFPADWRSWQHEALHATARLTGYLSEWAILEDRCKNEKFNAQDTSPLSWDRLFEELARWYGAPGVIPPSDDESQYHSLTGKPGRETPMGYGPPTVHRFSWSLVKWAKDAENKQAWEQMMAKSNGQLTANPFEDAEENFQMGDAILSPIGSMNMNKARRLGWTGYVDTLESIHEMYRENSRLGLVPEMMVSEPKPMV
ncbi:hypothetical protein BAUCODRAFT_32808 [Baudoinia panamericana UAMH 10762]|uniref:PRISE-like Rossmann-fold domain-containing protein n=1 Tax=Baudoinia panamericana (strain UAMH 10762) TaxID=717646 RepID=M2NDT6_BAUPA|nr:uncharacterized protein BAUCODRAFT_32808 [Baudoinia panamericana UAMH 10762]EMC97065.1 hypothetical protein BAUCODRAFT_32808 [Baudoinia panamericana UAMH 10762]